MTFSQRSPQGRPLEVNEIDHLLRCYGGSTVALEMEPTKMQQSKRPENIQRYLDTLSRDNGQLRLELAFYRDCFKHSERFKDTVSILSQDLFHECIIGLLDDAAIDDIKVLSEELHSAVEILRANQSKALSAFIAPYEAYRRASRPELSRNGMM